MLLLSLLYFSINLFFTIKIVLSFIFSSEFLTLGIIPGTNLQFDFNGYIIAVCIILLAIIITKSGMLINFYLLFISRHQSKKQKALDLISI